LFQIVNVLYKKFLGKLNKFDFAFENVCDVLIGDQANPAGFHYITTRSKF
jgi:hypothetical protein